MPMIIPDEYDKLFCRCDGSGASFVDSSTANPKTITANGNATQLPIKFNKSAGFFNGTTDYLDIANSTDFAFGTGAFTIEGFFNTGIDATAQTILDTRAATANTTGLLVNIINSTGNKLCVTTATTARITGTTTLAKNTWYHFMVVGNGGANGARTIILYLDGVQEGSTYTNDYNFTDQTLRIGAIKAAAGTYMKGWMKELRVSNGARTVAVPTTQYTTDANTVLLMHFDTPATSPLAPAIAFDGTGDYLSLADSADWSFAKNPFTVEGWFWIPALPGSYTGWVASSINGGGGGGWTLWPDSGGVVHFAKIHITDAVNSGTVKVRAGSWNHVAVVRTGTGATGLNIYLNGIAGTSPATGDVTLDSGGGGLVVGTFYTDITSYCMTGYAKEVRVSNVARYTANFTPSQTGFTVDANTKLYIKGDEDNGVTTFVDQTGKDVTTVGDTKIKYTEDYRSCVFKDDSASAHKPYPMGSAKVDFFTASGSGVGYFDGSGNVCTVTSNDFAIADNELFSFEGYGRLNSLANDYATPFSAYYAANTGWMVYFRPLYMGSGGAAMYPYTGGAIYYWNFTVPINSWFHFSWTRDSSENVRFFLNGVLQLTSTGAEYHNLGGAFAYGTDFGIGGGASSYAWGTYCWRGILDNIRISKGVARYTATFNPPVDYPDPVTVSKLNFFALF